MNEELIKALAKQGIHIEWGFDGKPQYYKGGKMLTGKAYGDTALFYTVAKKHEEIIKLLLEYGASTSLVNKYGLTVMTFAEETGCELIISLIKNEK